MNSLLFTALIGVGSILAGSEEQKQKWLLPMARMEKIGCFGQTEPLVGSGAGGGLTSENVYSGEVEAVIYKHAAVREVAVFGIPDPQWGELSSLVQFRTTRASSGCPVSVLAFTKRNRWPSGLTS